MANFSCNNREKKEYAKIKSRLEKMSTSDDFDVNLCLADMYAAVTRNLKTKYRAFSESRYTSGKYDDVLRDMLKILYEDMLSKTVLLDSLKYCHNQQFTIVGNRAIKPLLLDNDDLEGIFLNTQEDNTVELLAKTMDWVSKSSKEVELVSKNVLMDIPGDLELNGYTMRYINDYLSDVCMNGEIIRNHFLDDRLGFSDDLSDPVVNRVNEMLEVTNEKFGTSISLKDVYKYASCKRLEEFLYKLKAISQVELYRTEAQNRREGENTGVALDIERDKSMNGTNFNTKYNVFIPFYLNSFRDHSDGSSFTSLINHQVMNGDSVETFPLDSIDDIPFRPFLNFKLGSKRIYQIYNILEEYDNPKVNCFYSEETSSRLDSIYSYIADGLHYSIVSGDMDKPFPSDYLQSGDLQSFKTCVRQDREYYAKTMDRQNNDRTFLS